MKLFQIITSDGEHDGKFDVKFSEDINLDDELDDENQFIENIDIVYCRGDHWSEENPTKSLSNK